MNSNWKIPIIASTCALLGVGIIAITLLFFPWERPLEPLDVLPADATLLYIDGANKETAQHLTAFLPMDLPLPFDDTQSTFAIVKLPSGLAWIRFDAHTPGSSASMKASDPTALSLLVTDRNLSLRRDATFRRLTAPIRNDTSLLYVRRERLASLPLFTQLRVPNVDLAIGLHADQVQIAFPWNTNSPALPIDSAQPPTNTIVFVQTSDAQELIDGVSSLLHPGAQLSLQALLAQWIKNNFGGDVSLASALSPFLMSHATLALQSGLGTVHVALGATAPGLEERLQTLHAGFRSQLSASSRLERTFDERFHVDILSSDPSTIEEHISAEAGWALKETSHPRLGKEFVSAVRGNRVVMSTSELLLNAIVRGRRAMENDSSLVGWGVLDLPALQTFLVTHHWPLPLPNLAPFNQQQLKWMLARKGTIGILTLKQ